MAPPLDDFDLQLLALVQQDARLSQAELGARVNLSTAVVDPARIGIPLTPVVGLESESESERTDHCAALTRRLFVAGNKVRRFKTFVAMSRVKVGMAVPVDLLRRQGVAP